MSECYMQVCSPELHLDGAVGNERRKRRTVKSTRLASQTSKESKSSAAGIRDMVIPREAYIFCPLRADCHLWDGLAGDVTAVLY